MSLTPRTSSWRLVLGVALFELAALPMTISAQTAAAAVPSSGPRLTTPWFDEVPEIPHPEYPRPQLMRGEWLNLNGSWQFAVRPVQEGRPDTWDGRILVPFAIESTLSGVGRALTETQRLWYRRSFEVPERWRSQRVLLHFGAVDWEARVWVNGVEVGLHRGGYDGFSIDVSETLASRADDGDEPAKHELIVSVWDPTDAGTQPRGKQVREPGTIWYTAVTGIWQTVWLEPVPRQAIAELVMTPQLSGQEDRLSLKVVTDLEAGGRSGLEVVARALAPGEPPTVNRTSEIDEDGRARLVLGFPRPRRWTPDRPFLYDLEVELRDPSSGATLDAVRSYFGLREIALGARPGRPPRLLLNGEPLFHFGPLDQGWWPDGLYTPATDAALIHDLEVTKALGFNMLRKHVKVESDRFYYHCDRLGLMVWQDMPSGDAYIRPSDPDIERSPESAEQYRREWRNIIAGLRNHPSIVMWVPFNEGWGQFDTDGIVDFTRRVDPTRLVDATSGWADRGVGDVRDIHRYPGPGRPEWEQHRASVLGEFGGLGLPLPSHLWQPDGNWGYRAFPTRVELGRAYTDLIEKLRPMVAEGLAAAVYTQTSDVEIEVNGLMTYDRRVTKLDPKIFAPLNRSLYGLENWQGPSVEKEPFGRVNGHDATLFTLHSDGMTVRLSDFGGTLVGIDVPDRNGATADVLLGYGSAEPYGSRSTPYFGAIVGRYANRIRRGIFELDGKVYQLPVNNGVNSLHGGLDGLSRVLWQSEVVENERGVGVELTYRSLDGDEGYPGNLDVTVRYLLTPDRELRIETEAETDAPTVVNLSFHPYFNLGGHTSGDVLGHELQLLASRYTPVDETLIPTGELAAVDGTPMDFRELTPIGERIGEDFEQLRHGGGYDHNWVLDAERDRRSADAAGAAGERRLARAAVVRDPVSGRQLEVLTTQPGLQFYSGNFLDGSIVGKEGVRYLHRAGFCLEPQHFPDSPNQPDFPSTVLRPGERYRHVTVFRFSTF